MELCTSVVFVFAETHSHKRIESNANEFVHGASIDFLSLINIIRSFIVSAQNSSLLIAFCSLIQNLNFRFLDCGKSVTQSKVVCEYVLYVQPTIFGDLTSIRLIIAIEICMRTFHLEVLMRNLNIVDQFL